MKNILVIGSTGQIGSELTMKLRNMYPEGTVVAGYIKGSEPKGILLESGPAEEADVCNGPELENIVKKYNIDTIYNLAALLSAVAEKKPQLAWHIQIDGLMNILEIARNNNVAVFTPSSIGSFGPETPHENTPQDTIQRPRSMYGCTKVATELLSDYYHNKYGVDTRSVRFPGLISNVTLPGGGTTDYAVEIYYAAVKGEEFVCPIAHIHGHDVHARCLEGRRGHHERRPVKTEAPQLVQHRIHEFRSGNHQPQDSGAYSWLQNALRG